ncbi:MAG: SixA phosphatase family protein [Solirubrobacterales bacterium]
MIWLLRHGDAEDDADDDAARALTQPGREQAEAAGRALACMGVELDACLASPKVRAADTAAITCRALGLEPERTDALRGGDFDPAEMAAGRENVLLVGHEPDFSRAIAIATGGRVKLGKGGLAAIDGATLVVLMRPDELSAIAGR